MVLFQENFRCLVGQISSIGRELWIVGLNNYPFGDFVQAQPIVKIHGLHHGADVVEPVFSFSQNIEAKIYLCKGIKLYQITTTTPAKNCTLVSPGNRDCPRPCLAG